MSHCVFEETKLKSRVSTGISVHVGFVVDKVALGQVSPQYFGFPLSVSFHRAQLHGKTKKTIITFIT
jgi:hypothetical protein